MPAKKTSGRVDVCPFQRFGAFGVFGGSTLLSLKHYDARLGLAITFSVIPALPGKWVDCELWGNTYLEPLKNESLNP